jgi:hypothetical protein
VIASGLRLSPALNVACAVRLRLVVFGIALRWDASDRERRTRRADVAFWLHLLAAPLLVHPVFTTLGTWGGSIDGWRRSPSC